MSEARLVAAETGGLMPGSEGWFVLDAKEARWLDGDLGAYCPGGLPRARGRVRADRRGRGAAAAPAEAYKGLEYAWGSYQEGWLPG